METLFNAKCINPSPKDPKSTGTPLAAAVELRKRQGDLSHFFSGFPRMMGYDFRYSIFCNCWQYTIPYIYTYVIVYVYLYFFYLFYYFIHCCWELFNHQTDAYRFCLDVVVFSFSFFPIKTLETYPWSMKISPPNITWGFLLSTFDAYAMVCYRLFLSAQGV